MARTRKERRAKGAQEGEGELSQSLLERLALYYQIVTRLGEEGRDTVSSAEMSQVVKVDPTAVRHDMATVGIQGRPKVGYAVCNVLAKLDETLGLSSRNDAVLIGCGHLGGAIAAYSGFARYGLKITAVFDLDHRKVGQTIGGHVVLPMEKLKRILAIFKPEIAILTVPSGVAQEITDWLVDKGIRAIWNFAPVHLTVPAHVTVQNENLALGLAQLLHGLKRMKRNEPNRSR